MNGSEMMIKNNWAIFREWKLLSELMKIGAKTKANGAPHSETFLFNFHVLMIFDFLFSYWNHTTQVLIKEHA